MKRVTLYTDGGCQGNPGPGGWAAVLEWNGRTKELSGGEPVTTNNRMELRAAIEGLRILKEPCAIEFWTDSQYVRKGITEWIHGWKQNGWKTRTRQPVKNDDLWRELDHLRGVHEISWRWVKGHAGNLGNERCDQLAGAAIAKVRKLYSAQELRALVARYGAEG